MKKVMAVAAGLMMIGLSLPSHAGKMLKGDEIKALLSGKTVDVTYGDTKWRQYFAVDGKSVRDNGEASDWSVKGDEHCNTAAKKLPCAPVRDNGDGTYGRLKPDGTPLVTWTRIVDGKDF